MIRLRHAVQVPGRVERKLLVAVDVDHRPVAKWPLEPGSHRPIDVGTRRRFVILVVRQTSRRT
jgi:hypothetical protein